MNSKPKGLNRPEGIELNGVANACLMLHKLGMLSKDPFVLEETLKISRELLDFCKYVRAFEEGSVDFWHEWKAQSAKGDK